MRDRIPTKYIIAILFCHLLWLDQSSNIHVTPFAEGRQQCNSMYIVKSHNDSTRNCLSQELLSQCQMIQNMPTIEGILLFHAQPHHHSKVPSWRDNSLPFPLDNSLPFPLSLTIRYLLMISMGTTHVEEHSPISEVTRKLSKGQRFLSLQTC